MDKKNYTSLIVTVIIFVVGFVLGSLWAENKFLRNNQATPTGGTPTAAVPSEPVADLSKIPELTEDDHVFGNPDAEIILVEYSDFECPWCSRFHPTIQRIAEEYGDQVAWVYRHYPAPTLGHLQAQISAEASECVAKIAGNDAFWSFSDTMFKNASLLVEAQKSAGPALTEDKLLKYAADLGVNTTALKSCLDSNETADLVAEDLAGARAGGINGTPGTILITKEGEREAIKGAVQYEQLQSIIEKYL
ncbi:MAG: thioredoxin domain-containing protein [Candidatus Paceibacterota bacterium]